MWLEIHVDTHFNPSNSQPAGSSIYGMSMEAKRGSCSSDAASVGAVAAVPIKPRSQANSASSLTANVDENFEIDQIITLSECDNMMVEFQNGKFVKNEILLVVKTRRFICLEFNLDFVLI